MVTLETVLVLIWIHVARSNIILQSDRVTNWGNWGSWERCPTGSFATAFQLRVEQNVGDGDDTALNGIKLYCAKLTSPSSWIGSMTSKVGGFGDWTATQHCGEGFINGFQFRAERPQGRGDDTAANNLKVFCTGTGRTLEGRGTGWGDWGHEQRCYRNQAICAIRTQVEDYARNQGNTHL